MYFVFAAKNFVKVAAVLSGVCVTLLSSFQNIILAIVEILPV